MNVSVGKFKPEAFVIRKSVCDLLCSFDDDYENMSTKGLSLGFDIIRNVGIPYYVKGLFDTNQCQINPYSINLHLKPPAGGYRWLET